MERTFIVPFSLACKSTGVADKGKQSTICDWRHFANNDRFGPWTVVVDHGRLLGLLVFVRVLEDNSATSSLQCMLVIGDGLLMVENRRRDLITCIQPSASESVDGLAVCGGRVEPSIRCHSKHLVLLVNKIYWLLRSV